MGSGDIAQWQRDFYPVFNRQGLIVDVRHNNGGNIDSVGFSKNFSARHGCTLITATTPRRGICSTPFAARWSFCAMATPPPTARRSPRVSVALGLGKIIGTRTWGGEVWLTGSNSLVDRGIATAAEFGVYGPEGKWLIEGHGVEPDIVIDNLPRATFDGKDAQLEAAIKYLMAEIKKKPNPIPKVPAPPDKAFKTK